MRCPECGATLLSSLCPDEPPVGTWVRVVELRGRATEPASFLHERGGWSAGPGFYAFGRWEAMVDHWGPLEICGPYGKDLT